ncbi:hypothetical protein HKD37_16G044858 [Glycine soja]
MKNFFNSPLFDTSMKNVFGLVPLHGEPLTISTPLLCFPHESTTAELSKVQKEVLDARIPSPPLLLNLLLGQQRLFRTPWRSKSRICVLTKSYYSLMLINIKDSE